MFGTLYTSSFDYDFFLYSYPRAPFPSFLSSRKCPDVCSSATKNSAFEINNSVYPGIDTGTYIQDWDDLIRMAMQEFESVDWQPDSMVVAQRSPVLFEPGDTHDGNSDQDSALETLNLRRQRQPSSDSELSSTESRRPLKRLILDTEQGNLCTTFLDSPISIDSKTSRTEGTVDCLERLPAQMKPVVYNRSRSCSVDSVSSAQTAVNSRSPSTCSSYYPDSPDSLSKPHRPSLPRTMTMSSCASTLVPSVSSSRVQSPSPDSDSFIPHQTMKSNLKTKPGSKKCKKSKISDSRSNPWKCPYCSWVQHTQRMPDFLRHQRSHFTTQEDWPCPDSRCDKSFARKDSLKRHLENSRIRCKRPKGWDTC